jgi:signal peptidase I
VLNFLVDGSSMEPSFQPGEMALVNRNAYGELDAWDFVDWRPGIDEHNSSTIIEFGEPVCGDVIVFTPPGPGSDQPYIERVIGMPGDEIQVRRSAIVVDGVALNEGYADSENRCNRSWGYCGETEVTVPEGMVFLMGDNRSNSQDSRYFGPVPNENLIGRTWILYWPSNAWGPVPDQHYTGPVS